MPRPTAYEVSELLTEADITAYAAADLIDVSQRTLQRAVAGTLRLNASTWKLLRITLSQAAQDEMPEARIRRKHFTL